MNPGRSHELPPHYPPLEIIQDCLDEMEVTNTEGDAHQCDTDNNVSSDHAVPGTHVHTPNSGPSLSYLIPDPNPPDMLMPPSRGVIRSAKATSSNIQPPNNIQSGHFLSKLQPTVKDTTDNTDSDTYHDSSTNDNNFRVRH